MIAEEREETEEAEATIAIAAAKTKKTALENASESSHAESVTSENAGSDLTADEAQAVSDSPKFHAPFCFRSFSVRTT